jgi:predicted small lipoprotein YifL
VTKPAANIARCLLLPIAFVLILGLAGCGIKGPLELPEGAQVKDSEGKGKGEAPIERRLPGYQPSAQERKAAKQMGKPVKSDNPFFLDPLLK